ncbi:MAG TPA: alpha/beta hydrolase-fold protein [Streptosporangiaceae bacterium]|nr:alpha/beta hydrolase-fold protein [Streptosporangiaceae bacterium]
MPITLRTIGRRAGVLLASVMACALLAGPLSVIFPQTADAATVADSFDRANGGLGSNWTTVAGTAAPQISGNTLHAGTASALNSAYWSASTFGADQFAQGTLPASSGGNYGPGLAVRLSSSKGYILWYGNATNTVSLWRMDSASSWTQLKASGTLKITAATDVWKIQVVGSTITGYQNGTQVVQATDTRITSGSPGVWLYYAANQIDNWSGGDASAAPTTYSVGGSASGLASGSAVVLQNNGGNDLSVTASGAFTFSTALATGAAYNVTVKTNPTGQTCTVANGTGTVGAANVTSVAVTCAANPTYTVGGTASGLASGATVVLQNNGGGNLSVTANGTFTFSTALAPGAAYRVTVASNPPGQTCAVANGTGTIGAANVTNVAVTCTTTPTSFTVGGTVSGLASGATVVLQNNGGNDLSVTANGSFTFSTALATGAGYNVTVTTNPTGQTCTVASGTGTVGSANVTSVAVTCATSGGGGGGGTGGTTVADSFDRANGGLGANWTTVAGTKAPQISGNTVHAGTASALNSAYWSASTFGGNQFAQGTLPGSSGSNLGPGLAVRLSSSKGYFLWYGNATSTVSLWRMDSASSWTQLSSSNTLTITPASDVWRIQVVGSTITGYQNGTQVVQATDTSITTGSPGVWLYYAANQIDNWSGGDVATTPGSYTVGGTVSGLPSGSTVVLQNNGGNDLSVTASGAFTFSTALATGAAYNVTVKTSPLGQTCTVASGTGTVGSANVTNVAVTCATSGNGGGTSGLQVTYTGTDANGVQSYDTLSSADGNTDQVLRVLPPSNPAAGVKHNFLFMLPVEPDQGTSFGDAIATAAAANAQNQYNLTIIEPSFPADPWYADNPADTSMQYESFMTTQLVPWVKANLSITGTEQSWLIGFSKSGIGGQDLLLKHPDLFSVGAFWDFPAAMTSYDGADPYGTVGGNSAVNYGTNANFQSNYQLSSSFLTAHKTPFTSANRIWIGGYAAFQQDMASYDSLLTQVGIKHTAETPTPTSHAWDSGWVPQALAALEQDSVSLGG